MNDSFLAGVMQATQLTRAGKLAEATALLQRNLAGGTAPPRPSNAAGRSANDDVIDGECIEIVDREPRADSLPGEHADASAQPGRFITGQYGNAAGERAYKLYIPARYGGQPLPLIVMLHGCTQTPDDFAAGTQMNLLGDEQDCLVLYPAQSKGANASHCWNWFRREDQQRDRGEPSIVAGMTRSVVERYKTDAGKVYVAGLSAGGAMAAVMGVTYPELYAAVGIHSGLACGSAHDLPSALAAMKGMPADLTGNFGTAGARPHATPTIVFHGDRDRTVHPRNGAEVISQSAHANAAGGEVTTERGQAQGGHAYTRTIHRDAAGRVVLEHWLVHGGGHAWFGGSRTGSYSDPRGPSASREMVRFFRQTA